jgi:hypothetical protein
MVLECTEERLDECEAQVDNLEVDELTALRDGEAQQQSRAKANCKEETARHSLSSSSIIVDNISSL